MLPCETTVKAIVPSIKSNIAKNLKASGEKQKEIAKVLGVTEAAVSMYISGRRGAVKANRVDATELVRHKEVCKVCRTMQGFCKGVQ